MNISTAPIEHIHIYSYSRFIDLDIMQSSMIATALYKRCNLGLDTEYLVKRGVEDKNVTLVVGLSPGVCFQCVMLVKSFINHPSPGHSHSEYQYTPILRIHYFLKKVLNAGIRKTSSGFNIAVKMDVY